MIAKVIIPVAFRLVSATRPFSGALVVHMYDAAR
jgi:hypothetical protein